MNPNEILWMWLCGLSFLCGMMVCIAVRFVTAELKRKRHKERAEWHTQIWLNSSDKNPIQVTLDQWNAAYNETARQNRLAEASLRVKSIVFMRLNSARDRRDKRAIELYREIQQVLK